MVVTENPASGENSTVAVPMPSRALLLFDRLNVLAEPRVCHVSSAEPPDDVSIALDMETRTLHALPMPEVVGVNQSGALPAPTQVVAPPVPNVTDTVLMPGVDMEKSCSSSVHALFTAPWLAFANMARTPLM